MNFGAAKQSDSADEGITQFFVINMLNNLGFVSALSQKRLELKQKIETKNGDVRGNHDDNEEEDHMDEF